MWRCWASTPLLVSPWARVPDVPRLGARHCTLVCNVYTGCVLDMIEIACCANCSPNDTWLKEWIWMNVVYICHFAMLSRRSWNFSGRRERCQAAKLSPQSPHWGDTLVLGNDALTSLVGIWRDEQGSRYELEMQTPGARGCPGHAGGQKQVRWHQDPSCRSDPCAEARLWTSPLTGG